MNGNIKYANDDFVAFYSRHRRTWNEFYESERHMFDKVFSRFDGPFSLLDAGCGCGGLGNALSEKFAIKFYKGLDINEQQIKWASENSGLSVPCEFVCADIAEYEDEQKFDAVVSLSCVDYNVEVNKMIESAWARVRPGGYFISSIRLTTKESINDIERAFQYINYESENDTKGGYKQSEIANYVVFSLDDILGVFGGLENAPAGIEAYGYWGAPSKTAVIEYDELCMSVFALRKPEVNEDNGVITVNLELPGSFFAKTR